MSLNMFLIFLLDFFSSWQNCWSWVCRLHCSQILSVLPTKCPWGWDHGFVVATLKHWLCSPSKEVFYVAFWLKVSALMVGFRLMFDCDYLLFPCLYKVFCFCYKVETVDFYKMSQGERGVPGFFSYLSLQILWKTYQLLF